MIAPAQNRQKKGQQDMAVLINGDGYEPVTAQQEADIYEGIFGKSLRVLNVGGKLAASIVSATCVRLADGEAIIQGRRIHVDAGTYDDFEIPAGTQGTTKYYVIGYELYRDIDTDEKCRAFVQEVESATATVAVGGVIRDGATSIKAALYRVQKEGVNIGEVTALFEEPRTMTEIYPVGGIYISATNPAAFFGGTWTEIQGKFLLGRGSGRAAGVSSGREKVTLVENNIPAHTHAIPAHHHSMAAHTHTGTTSSSGAHTHTLHRWLAGGTGTARYAAQGDNSTPTYSTGSAGAHTHSFTTNAGGSGNTGNWSGNTGSTGKAMEFSIMPPFLTVYIWQRVA